MASLEPLDSDLSEPPLPDSRAVRAPKPDRELKHYVSYALTIAALVITPLLAGTLLPARQATVVMLCALPILALALGGLDARFFRQTLSFPILVGVAFALTSGLFYNSGVWIYALPIALITWFGGKVAR